MQKGAHPHTLGAFGSLSSRQKVEELLFADDLAHTALLDTALLRTSRRSGVTGFKVRNVSRLQIHAAPRARF